MKKLFIALLAVLIIQQSSTATNEALLIWEIPVDIQAATQKSYTRDDIVINEIKYVSSSYKNKPVIIFGYFCYPKNGTNLPAVALIHGGGGYAVLSRTIDFAKRGYAALSIDLPGKGEMRSRYSRSTGPDMDVPTLLRVSPNITYNYLYHAVAAARSAITYLEQQPQVNKNKIGMVGFSWGGVITLMANGTDQRLAAAVPVFGSGFLDRGSTWQSRFDNWMSEVDKATYNKYFDAKNYLATQHAPLLYLTGTNDHCFYIPNFIKSFLNMPKEKVKLAIYPNGRHRVSEAMMNNIFHFLDSKLKGQLDFPVISAGQLSESGQSLLVPINWSGSYEAESLCLYYSKSGITGWTKKQWARLNVFIQSGTAYAEIPKWVIRPEALYYASLRDRRGAYVSTPIQVLMRTKINDGRTIYLSSTPVEEILYHRITPQTWEEIVKKKCDISGEAILFGNLNRIGAKIQNKKYYYQIDLP